MVKINVDNHIWLNKLMRYNHSFNDQLLILKICIKLMHVFWMTTLMHRNINPILDKVALYKVLFLFLKKWNLLFPGFQKRVKFGSHFTAESLTTVRWGAFGDFEMTIWKRKNNHKRKCNSRVCCDLTENFVVYMTLELKSDMIVPYAHSCIQYNLWK